MARFSPFACAKSIAVGTYVVTKTDKPVPLVKLLNLALMSLCSSHTPFIT